MTDKPFHDADTNPATADDLVDTLVQALLAVEWAQRKMTSFAGGVLDACPACGRFRWPDEGHNSQPGKCPLDEALTAVGLPDQASRDEARRIIKREHTTKEPAT